MLVVEFIISVVILLLYIIISIMLFRVARKSPIIEIKLLALTSFLSLIFFTGMLLTALFNEPYTFCPWTEPIFRIGFAFAQLCILTISFTFILPDLKYKYSSIAQISLITAINTASTIINATTITLKVTEYIKLHFEPLGLLLFLLSSILIFFAVIQRLVIISRVVKQKGKRGISARSSLIMSVIMSSYLVVIILDTIFFTVPGYSYTIPLLIGGLYLSYIIKKNPAVFFLTPTSLEAVIIIIDQKSNLVIFSRSFVTKDDDYDLQDWQLVGGFFSALNISLRIAIKSDSGIEQVSFGDKNVILALGLEVACLLIVTEVNFITYAISRYLVKRFEQLYREKLIETSFRSANFDDFELVVGSIRRYLPL